jgi:putative ABC transport system permease protein
VTALLTWAFGRLPIGWLQLVHNPARLAAAVAGVAFANVLVFVQLGFMGALNESAILPYRQLDADILISAPDTNTLSQGGNVPRRRAYQALSVPGVAKAMPLYIGAADWTRPEGTASTMHVFGVNPADTPFRSAELNAGLKRLQRLDVALVDARTRGADPAFFGEIERRGSIEVEIQGRRLTFEDTFEIGPGFEADGYLIVSDETFLNLFPDRSAGAPNHILVETAAGADPAEVVERLRAVLPSSDALVRTLADAAAADQRYQTTERPTGVVFGFGVVMGVLVGVVIVYQVLSTDVADHLSEYATLKAMGYRQRFFLGIVFEEAIVLALFGFVPGLLISLGIYQLVVAATGLPVVMTGLRPFIVFAGTLLMCTISGAIATRRLAAADPADLF